MQEKLLLLLGLLLAERLVCLVHQVDRRRLLLWLGRLLLLRHHEAELDRLLRRLGQLHGWWLLLYLLVELMTALGWQELLLGVDWKVDWD